MSIATVRFHSEALGRQTTYSAILPDGGPGPYPVLMLLHGYGDDHTAWLTSSRLAEHVSSYPLLVLLPDGGTSAYLNLRLALDPSSSLGLQRYEDLLVRDLPDHVARTFRVRPGPWAIGGLSMGGFGAIRLGLKYPDRFASVWAHSGAYYSRDQMVGYYPDPDDADVYGHADRLMLTDAAGPRPEITFDCGTEDDLVGHGRRLHAHLSAIGLPHRYLEEDGGHTWEYWDRQLRPALAQHARVLGIT